MKLFLLLRFSILVLLTVATASAQGILSYTDNEGRTHFVDRPEAIPKQFQQSAEERKDLPAINRVPEQKFHGTYGAQKPKVQILVTSWCGYCQKLEDFLRKNNIRFTKHDIEKSPTGRKLYSRHGSGGVPVTIIDGKVIRGYNPNAILSEIGGSNNRPNVT